MHIPDLLKNFMHNFEGCVSSSPLKNGVSGVMPGIYMRISKRLKSPVIGWYVQKTGHFFFGGHKEISSYELMVYYVDIRKLNEKYSNSLLDDGEWSDHLQTKYRKITGNGPNLLMVLNFHIKFISIDEYSNDNIMHFF